jgi:hypothetical protein
MVEHARFVSAHDHELLIPVIEQPHLRSPTEFDQVYACGFETLRHLTRLFLVETACLKMSSCLMFSDRTVPSEKSAELILMEMMTGHRREMLPKERWGALTARVVDTSLDGLDDLEDDAGSVIEVGPAVLVRASVHSRRQELGQQVAVLGEM